MDKGALPPHVLIFPLPRQGPVNSNLKLAELLCLSGLHVTFFLTEHIYGRLLRHTDIQSRVDRYPGFRIATVSDGLPEDHPRTGPEVILSVTTILKNLRETLVSGRLSSETRRPVTCIIADGTVALTSDIGKETGIPIIYVRTIGACFLWVVLCLPKLLDSGEVPFQGNDLDTLIKGVTGTETFLRRRDLPAFCRKPNLLDDPEVQMLLKESHDVLQASGFILNTFEDLEGPILSQVRTLCPNVYTIGPLHAHLKTKLAKEATSTGPTSSNNSFWEVDRTCMEWLDTQPAKSVIFVSFGSVSVITKDQLMEIWYGLVNSGQRFLWVIRPDLVIGEDKEGQIPAELSEGTKQRGYIVGWAPQEEVLAHPAVGGFLTHSGWNSTMESIYEGMPMICWPHSFDQQGNSRFVGEVWKLGLDMKDSSDRVTVAKMVREFMEVKKDEFQKSADEMANRARSSLSEGGSSYSNFQRLIKDIELMCSRV